jgi:hypothetical protein
MTQDRRRPFGNEGPSQGSPRRAACLLNLILEGPGGNLPGRSCTSHPKVGSAFAAGARAPHVNLLAQISQDMANKAGELSSYVSLAV